MKRFLLLIIVFFPSFFVFSQDGEYKTIFDRTDFKISGFGGPCMSFTSLDGEFAHMMGGGGGIMLGDFFFGGYGMGMTNNVNINGNDLDFGHGGLWFGYSFLANKAIHPSIHVQTGWGSIEEDIPYTSHVLDIIDDKVFVLVPTVEMEFNFTKFFRVSLGASYRTVYGSEESNFGLKDSDLASPSAFLGFKFGWF